MGMNGAAAGEIAEETKARLLEMPRADFGQCVARDCAQQLRKIGACTEECGHAAHGNALRREALDVDTTAQAVLKAASQNQIFILSG